MQNRAMLSSDVPDRSSARQNEATRHGQFTETGSKVSFLLIMIMIMVVMIMIMLIIMIMILLLLLLLLMRKIITITIQHNS